MTPLAVFLLCVFAIYVGTVQAAFSAMMRLSRRIMAERAGRSDALGQYLEDPARLFIPARLLLALAVILVAELLARVTGVASLHQAGLLFAALLAFVVVCEHLLPWLIASRNPQQVLEVLLPSFGWFAAPLSPLTRGLRRMAARRDGTTPAEESEPAATPAGGEPDTAAIAEGGEHQLLRSIVGFGDRLVREVMTPRPDIVAIQADASLADLRAFFREQEYSRIPVYKDDIDNILGFAFVKDLIKHAELPATAPVTEIMRPAFFVPETKRVPDLLREFQRHQVQSAIVVDEYGGTAGLVSLEDLIEEIVGEIRDEYDVETEPIAAEADDAFLVSGRVSVDQVTERLGIAIQGEGFETFGGYLLSRLGRVPQSGERFDLDDIQVEVLEADRRRILRVRVRRLAPVREEAS
jgi:CBS domain containing-hemolysin-like protein